MITIFNESGLSLNCESLDDAVNRARDYILALMEDCDLTGRVVIIDNGVHVKALTWEDIW